MYCFWLETNTQNIGSSRHPIVLPEPRNWNSAAQNRCFGLEWPIGDVEVVDTLPY